MIIHEKHQIERVNDRVLLTNLKYLELLLARNRCADENVNIICGASSEFVSSSIPS